MRRKVTGICFLLVMLIFSGCTNIEDIQTHGETTTSTKQPKQIETSTPNISELQDFTSDCSKVVIPSNVERDTNLDIEKGFLAVHWYDDSKGKNMGVVFRYGDQNCSESAKQLIQHVLQTEAQNHNEVDINLDWVNKTPEEIVQYFALIEKWTIKNFYLTSSKATINEEEKLVIINNLMKIYAKEEAEEMFAFVYKTVDHSYEVITSDHFPIGGLNKDIKTDIQEEEHTITLTIKGSNEGISEGKPFIFGSYKKKIIIDRKSMKIIDQTPRFLAL